MGYLDYLKHGTKMLSKKGAMPAYMVYFITDARNVGIPTNGSTTARTLKIVEDVLKSCPDLDFGIDVSFDGVGALHDEIRVFPGLFERSVQTYRELKKLSKHYPRLNVNVETTVS